MDELSKKHASTAATVLVVLTFVMIMLVLLEVPLLGYAIRPESTDAAVQRSTGWLSRSGARIALIGGTLIGIFLVARGTISVLG
jgi:Sap, sulfolipid-1-addressing protein